MVSNSHFGNFTMAKSIKHSSLHVLAAMHLMALGACSGPHGDSRAPGATTPDTTTTPHREATAPRPDGTITSGGGLIYGVKANPWFLVGQSSPTWCLAIDPTNFGIGPDAAAIQIEKSLSEWESVSKIKFRKSECTNETDLRFLLGKIDPQDKSHLAAAGFAQINSLKETAAVTIQTNYDASAMRGRGFIYVAPEAGPLAIAGANVADKPWQRLDGKLFQLVIAHELGHVFGLQHNAEGDGLMGSRTLEYMMDGNSVAAIESDLSARAAFDERLANMQPASLVKFADVSEFERCTTKECTKVVITKNGPTSMLIDIWRAPSESFQFWGNTAWSRISTATLTEKNSADIPISSVFSEGQYKSGMTATRSRLVGTSDNGNSITVLWTAGKTPLVLLLDGTELTTILE